MSYVAGICLSFVFLFSTTPAFCSEFSCQFLNSSKEYAQWFTGPIITPNPATVPPSHPGLELVLIGSKTYGFYDSQGHVQKVPSIWGISPLFDFQAGLNDVIGVELIGSMIANFSKGESATYLGDTIFRLGFQITTDKPDSWIPDFRILLQETFPTGKYQKLSPKKNRADCTGQGSFQTGIQLVSQKLFHSKTNHPFRLRGTLSYFVPSAVNVNGLNFYGGEVQTKGTIYPGKYFSGFLYGEYALSRRWALACEFNYQQGENGRFSKKKGTKINVPSFNQMSILPEIQHTYTENLGIVLGGWFTVTGKNSQAFSKVFGAVLFLF